MRIAVISGTGMSDIANEMSGSSRKNTEIRVESNWGEVPTILVETELGEVLLVDRQHREGDARTPPHEIEHRANIHAAKSFSPDLILSVNSVGTMIEDLPPGMICLLYTSPSPRDLSTSRMPSSA